LGGKLQRIQKAYRCIKRDKICSEGQMIKYIFVISQSPPMNKNNKKLKNNSDNSLYHKRTNFFKFSTIHNKLSAILLSFAVIIILISFISFNYIEKAKDNLSSIKQIVEETYILLLEDARITHDFYNYETVNSNFFETGKSNLLNKHYKICNNIDISINKLTSNQKKYNFELDHRIKELRSEFVQYRILTDTIVRLIKELGFKDHGIEGKMRSYAHMLEKYDKEIGLVNILQLRRHEKDFIVRQENEYIVKHSLLFNKINGKLLNNNKINRFKKNEIIFILKNYSEQFIKLAGYTNRIGLKNRGGIKKRIDETVNEMDQLFENMTDIAYQKEILGISQIKNGFLLFWSAFLCLSIIVSLFVSKKVSLSITNLKERITEFVKSDFTKRVMIPIKDSQYEVDILTNNFSIMEQQIVDQINTLKQTNKELEMLFYRASHDIKGPLSTIKGLTNIAVSEISDPLSLKYFLMISKSWEKLNHIVDELGMITDIKCETSKTEIIDFEELSKSAFLELGFMDGFDKITFSVDLHITKTFYSDQKLIKTILSQLIENSIKYANKTGIAFIKISIGDKTDNVIKIVVSDNGMGIKKEYHTKIFDMFFRATPEPNGTGLGLYIVQNSLQKLNGAISIESEDGMGTTFNIILPNKIEKKNVEERMIQKREIARSNFPMILNYI
jgi:signal transduction histidine kinase